MQSQFGPSSSTFVVVSALFRRPRGSTAPDASEFPSQGILRRLRVARLLPRELEGVIRKDPVQFRVAIPAADPPDNRSI